MIRTVITFGPLWIKALVAQSQCDSFLGTGENIVVVFFSSIFLAFFKALLIVQLKIRQEVG